MANADLVRLRVLVDEGYLTAREHPDGLIIWNYTAKTQFERVWTPSTMMCRGLITDPQGKVVARPFPKFFNYGEQDVELPAEPFEVYEKMDGSLGILYQSGGIPYIATRGSFDSEQAQHATKILHDKYHDYSFDPSLTYLFEIVYPQNRIVVDYGNMDDIILLAVIETKTGKELSLDEIGETPFPKVRRYDGVTDIAQVKALGRENQEGFVVRFTKSNLRVKIKLDEYIRLHKIMTGMSERTIWEQLASNQNFDQWLENVPDEFYYWAQSVMSRMQTEYSAIYVYCLTLAGQADIRFKTRKEQAEYIKRFQYAPIIFCMLDSKDHTKAIWNQIKPTATQAFRMTSEATN